MTTARLAARDGSPLRAGRVFVLSASWGIGAGLGVALGAVLTSVSGAGAPGLSGLDATSELVVVPWIVGGAVLMGHLAVTLATALVRGSRTRQAPPQREERDERRPEDGIDGHVGAEVPPSQQ
jgi:hypothetical protein